MDSIETAILAAEIAEREIAKLKKQFQFGQPEFAMAEYAHLAADLALRRLKELQGEAAKNAGRPRKGT
jgi:hypothetical protein